MVLKLVELVRSFFDFFKRIFKVDNLEKIWKDFDYSFEVGCYISYVK